jgi:hypothetical protein
MDMAYHDNHGCDKPVANNAGKPAQKGAGTTMAAGLAACACETIWHQDF